MKVQEQAKRVGWGIILPQSDALCLPSGSATELPKLALFLLLLLLLIPKAEKVRLFGIWQNKSG